MTARDPIEPEPDPRAGAAGPDDLGRLVAAAYDATVEPMRYEALLTCWEAFLESRAAQGAPEGLLRRLERGEDPEAAAVIAHFARAMEIFERLGRARRLEAGAQAAADGLPGVGLVADASGRIVALNAAAAALAAPERDPGAPLGLEALGFDREAAERAMAWIRGRAGGVSAEIMAIPCERGAPPQRSCLILTPVDLARSHAAPLARARPGESGPHFLIASLDLHFDKEIVEAFAEAFRLSASEGAVAAELARGARPADIAERRGASLNTVRSQIKSLTRKIGAEGAADLVRLFSGFAASFSAARAAGRLTSRRLAAHGLRREGMATQPSGRRVGYVEQGAANGRPVLFLHSLCFGPYWPDRAIEAAARRRWRLIGPWRPGFGDTDPPLERGVDHSLDACAADMIRLLDHLGIARALVVAHQTASIYALRLAQAAPGRVRGILSVGHLPIWRDEMIALLPPRMRLFARTARYAPRLLPFIARGAVALVDAGEERRLGRAYFRGSEGDLRAIERAEVFAPMAEGLIGAVRQGPFAFCLDAEIGLRDFRETLSGVTTPIRVLHGAEDQSMPPAVFAGAERLAPSLETTCLPEAGATLLYTHWPAVLDQLDRLHAETPA